MDELNLDKIRDIDLFSNKNIPINIQFNKNGKSFLLSDNSINESSNEQINDNDIFSINNNKYLIDRNNNINNNSNIKLYKNEVNDNNHLNSSQQNLNSSICSKNHININNNLENKKFENIKDTPHYKNRKKVVKQITVSLLCCIIIIGFVFFISNESQRNKIKNFFNFSFYFWLLISCFILLIIIIILKFCKNKRKALYNKIALEDFEILKKNLYENNYGNKGEYNSIFENEFIKNRSVKRNIEKEKYIKYIFPIINELIKNFNERKFNNTNDEGNFIIKK